MNQNDNQAFAELERHGIAASCVLYINNERAPAITLESVRDSGFAVRGERVRFLNEHGYDIQRRRAAVVFDEGQLLTVDTVNIGRSSSTYTFYGFVGGYNTVMFEKVNS
jgi:hypothetical protein